MNNKTTQDPIYDLKSVKLPYLSGAALRLFAALLEGPLGSLLIPSLFRSSGITWLREQRFDEPPTGKPSWGRKRKSPAGWTRAAGSCCSGEAVLLFRSPGVAAAGRTGAGMAPAVRLARPGLPFRLCA